MAKKNLKYPAEKIDELLTKADEQMATKTDLKEKVDKVDGKGLSTNDYSTAEKNKLASIQEGAQRNTVTSVRGALELYPQVGDVVISAGSIGLGDANTRLTALENDKLDKSEKGATNGVASLDENGRVPSSQLPSYVDDVIDDYTYAQFPATGETGKIYIAKDTNKTYRWSGSGYAEISASLALGETEQTAYSGAKGKKNAEDIAKLAADLDETHQLASNAESAVSEVVELTIPAIESEVANKATKSEAQGYATTAKNEAIAAAATDAQNKANTAESEAKTYADGKVKGLADGQVATNKANIASLQTAQTSLSATVKTNGNNIATHTQQIANLDSNKLGKTEKAADSAKADYATSAGSATNATNASQLGGVAASGYARLSGAQFTGLLNASTVFRVNASAEVNKNCIVLRAETVGSSSNQGLAHIGTNYGNSYPDNYEGLQNIVDAIAIYRSVVGIGRTFTFDELLSVYSRGERMYVNGTTNSHIYTSGDVSAAGANPTSFFRWGRFDENGGLKMQFGADSGAKWELINKTWKKALFSVDTSGNQTLSGTMTASATYHTSDERLKTFEGDVEVDLEKLKALPKKYFHWTADADGKRQLGTSAQAVEEIFPELVSTNADGYKSVNYANLSIIALAAVDKLAEQNAELERRLAKIEALLNIE